MQFHFENQGSRTYLVYDIFQKTQLDFSAKEMITNNNIPGMANAIFMQIDEKYCIRYDVSSMISASQLFSGMISKKLLIGFFRGIADAFQSVEDYMLDEDMLILDCDYIFTNVTTGKTAMVCLPIQDKFDLQKPKDKMLFLKEILYHAQFDMHDDSRYIAHLMNYMNKNSSFSAESLKNLLDSIEEMAQEIKPVQHISVRQPSFNASQNIIQPQGISSIPVSPVLTQNSVEVPKVNATSLVHNTPPIPEIPKNMPVNMAIPCEKKSVPVEKNDVINEDDKISWLYLMQHYNKENAAKYKAQKSAKKAQKSSKKVKSDKKEINNHAMSVPEMQQPVGAVSQSAIPALSAVSNQSISQQVYSSQMPATTVPATPQQVYPSPIPVQQSNFSSQPHYAGTTVLNPSAIVNAGTTVLNPAMQKAKRRAYLYRIATRDNIEITSSIFKIGRESTFVNYCVSNNPAISGSHAYIMDKDDTYFLIDTNSTNKTYVNNLMIQSNVEVEIHSGDKIRFADEEFEFKVI